MRGDYQPINCGTYKGSPYASTEDKGTRLFLSATSGGVHKPRKQALFFRVLPTAVPSEKGFVLPTYCPWQFSATRAGAVQLLFHLHAEVCVTKRLSCTFMHSTEELKSAFHGPPLRRKCDVDPMRAGDAV